MLFETAFSYLKHLCDCKIRPDIIWGSCEALYKFELINYDEYCMIMHKVNELRKLPFWNKENL